MGDRTADVDRPDDGHGTSSRRDRASCKHDGPPSTSMLSVTGNRQYSISNYSLPIDEAVGDSEPRKAGVLDTCVPL